MLSLITIRDVILDNGLWLVLTHSFLSSFDHISNEGKKKINLTLLSELELWLRWV